MHWPELALQWYEANAIATVIKNENEIETNIPDNEDDGTNQDPQMMTLNKQVSGQYFIIGTRIRFTGFEEGWQYILTLTRPTDQVNTYLNKVDSVGPNRFDSPAALYYKIVFYFSDEHGLLGLYNVTVDNTDPSVSQAANMSASFTGSSETPQTIKNNVFRNTAYNYLLLNDEMERAEYLKRFLILLSDISADSPWYFQEISGLDAALERKVFSDGEFKIEDKPKSITIKCLNDSYDNRIGTLLDLYRAACFSYQNKKEIVPANLRKFNMGILVFNAPIRGKGGKSGDPNNMILIPGKLVMFLMINIIIKDMPLKVHMPL